MVNPKTGRGEQGVENPGVISMAITQAQLRTLRLLNEKAARRIYRSQRASDYTWVHDDTNVPLTPTLHRLLSSGYVTISSDDKDVAIITKKGRAVIATQSSY